MPDVMISQNTTLPDGRVIPAGTLIKNVPQGTTRQQLLNKLSKSVSALGVAGRAGLSTLTDNVMGMVDAPLNLFARATNASVRKRAELSGQPPGIGLINTPPLSQNFLMPSSNQIFAGAQVAGEKAAQLISGSNIPVASLEQAQQRQQAITQAGRQQHPIAAGVGNTAAGAFTLMSLRGPIAAQRGLTQLAHVRNVQAARKLAKKSANAVVDSPTLSKSMEEAVKHLTLPKTMANRAGRAAEAGLEGLTLALLDGGDPIQVAAYTAGGQAAGGILLGGISVVSGGGGLISKGGRLMIAAAGIGALIQIFKAATPGGQDILTRSIESGFDKVTFGLALGILSGIAGAGRVTSRFPVKALPEIADAITSLQRGATISLLNDAVKDPNVEKVINKLARNPNYFGPAATAKLRRAVYSERLKVSDTIKDLMENPAFLEKMEKL